MKILHRNKNKNKNKNKECPEPESQQKQKQVLNTPRKRVFILSFILYYPLITLMVGSPYPHLLKDLPFPYSLFDLDETVVKLIETTSTTLGLIASVSVGVFWIHKQSNNKHVQTNIKIDELETNLCIRIKQRFDELEKKIEEKDEHQTKIFDQKILGNAIEIGHLKETDKEMKEDIQHIERRMFNHRKYGEHNPLPDE